jgi:porin
MAQCRLKSRSSTGLMCGRRLRLLFLSWCGLCALAFPAHPQVVQQEQVPGPDSHETGQGPHGHLFGTWSGERTRLQERSVNFDFQYVSDSLWNLESEQKERFAKLEQIPMDGRYRFRR